MRILLVNKFWYPKGGAEVSLLETADLLTRRGHEVLAFSMAHPRNLPAPEAGYFVSRVEYDDGSLTNVLRASARLLYSVEAKRNIRRLIADGRPDLAHLNNIYHQISPSIIDALKAAGVPMVMTLRDYKMVCGSYALLANGGVCEACRGGRYYQSALKRCVKDSRAKSLLATAEMYLHHTILRIYDGVELFLSPSRFLKAKIEAMGFRKRVVVLPNFVRAQEYAARFDWEEPTIVYLGRLSKEKGLFTLLTAMKGLPDVGLNLIGAGPLETALEETIRSERLRNVRLVGELAGEALRREVRRAMFVVLPSEWYENHPRAILEAFACGKPAVATRMGGIPELVRDGETGLTCEPRSPEDLRAKILTLVRQPEEIRRMGRRARRLVEEEFNEDLHYQQLSALYGSVLNGASAKTAVAGRAGGRAT